MRKREPSLGDPTAPADDCSGDTLAGDDEEDDREALLMLKMICITIRVLAPSERRDGMIAGTRTGVKRDLMCCGSWLKEFVRTQVNVQVDARRRLRRQ